MKAIEKIVDQFPNNTHYEDTSYLSVVVKVKGANGFSECFSMSKSPKNGYIFLSKGFGEKIGNFKAATVKMMIQDAISESQIKD